MARLTKDDFVKMSWQEYDCHIQTIYRALRAFLDANGIKIDYIIPVIRGGAVPAVSLSYLFDTVPFGVLQLKHNYAAATIDVVSNFLSAIPKQTKTVMLVDGYHASGRTAYMAYDMIKKELPHVQVIYVTLGRDVGYLENKRDFLFSISAFYSNECGVIPKAESEQKGVLTKYMLFPWEVLEDELANMNDELIYGG